MMRSHAERGNEEPPPFHRGDGCPKMTRMAALEHDKSPPSPLAAAVFGTTIFVGAFLLFQSQPLVSKAILPWFGGCPAVWTTCMLFFQTLLFGGYLYAHLLQSRFTPRGQIAVHLAVVVAALIVLPIVPGNAWKPTDGENPAWQILWLLTCTVGLPYFAVSATSPLVQTWFGGVFPDRSPYRLYALSNIGSLVALLTYPFVFEPAFALPMQSRLWSVTFAAYAMLCAACFWPLRRWRAMGSPLRKGATAGLPSSAWEILRDNTAGQASSGTREVPTQFDRFCWMALPACASLMLLATTNHVCQDVAVVPFLWVVPLALYLLSFIICFDHARWYVRWLWSAAAALALIGVGVNDYIKIATSYLSLIPELALYFSALFFVCMTCHGELVRRKPAARHLTEFYLWISVGGALGGLLVGIVAPLVFSTYFEWQIGVAVSFVLALGLLLLPGIRSALQSGLRLVCIGAFLLTVGGGLYYLMFWMFVAGGSLEHARNFFGATLAGRVGSMTGTTVVTPSAPLKSPKSGKAARSTSPSAIRNPWPNCSTWASKFPC